MRRLKKQIKTLWQYNMGNFKPETIWLNRDGDRLYRYQEQQAQMYAAAIIQHDSVVLSLPSGCGKRIILHRIVQILQDKFDSANKRML